MKSLSLVLPWHVLLAIALLSGPATSPAAEFDAYRQTYEKKLLEIQAQHAADTNALTGFYKTALESLLAKVKAAGDLAKVKAVLAELERQTSGATGPDDLPTIPEVVSLRTALASRSAHLEKKRAGQIVDLTERYDEALEKVQKNLVKVDKLDEAKAVQAERARARDERAYLDARKLVESKPVSAPRPSPFPPPEPEVSSRSLPPDLRQGLLVRYSFDDARSELKDDSGNGRDGDGTRAHFSPKGHLGRALECDGADSFAVLASGHLGDLGQATVCAWVKPGSAQDAPILEFSADNFRYGPHLWSKPDGRLYVNFWGRPGNDRIVLTRPGLLKKGEWTHVALVYDGRKGMVYADGKQVGVEAWDDLRLETRYPFYLGARQGWRGGNVLFDGSIDEVMVYDRPLSGREIQQLVRMKP